MLHSKFKKNIAVELLHSLVCLKMKLANRRTTPKWNFQFIHFFFFFFFISFLAERGGSWLHIFVNFGNTIYAVIVSSAKCVCCFSGKITCLHFNTVHIDDCNLFTASECTTEGHYICQGFTLLDVNWDICLTMSPPAFLVPIYRQ